jgi:hypothetical protein
VTITPSIPPAAEAAEPHVHGETIVYRLFDVGYAIQLDRACELLSSSAPERLRPVRGEAQAIQIPNPPVTVGLGTEAITVAGERREAELSARIFDFGVISLRARIASGPGLPWSRFAAHGADASAGSAWSETLTRALDPLLERIGPAIERSGKAPVTEDYVVFRVNRLEDAAGERMSPEALRDEDIARLLLGEPRPLSAAARRELLSPRFTYFEDDLAVLTWGSALVVEPVVEDTDVQYVLEFANAQLLELRFYDAVLDAELPDIYMRIAEARQGFHLLGRRFSRLLADLHTRVADATELVERVENSLKVTDDVFLARIYAAALELFRGRTWRSGIDRKVTIVRETYDMLNAESQSRRAEVLEIIIVLLIMFEILLTLMRR